MRKLLIYLLAWFFLGCREEFESPVRSAVTGYLVVEGVVNSGQGSTTLKLSRTTSLETRAPLPESGAIVKLQGEDNTVIDLPEKTNGEYGADQLLLNNSIRYRLNIITSGGREYLSDYVVVCVNPPVDSITYKQSPEGLELFVNANNPLGNTRYYQWTYSEAWQIISYFKSSIQVRVDPNPPARDELSVEYRDSSTFGPDFSLDTCYQFSSFDGILLGSSAKLIRDEINLPVLFIPSESIKLGRRYSINVRQYAWTKEGYQFLETMKKNTESLGSIFDPQPSELKGNIRSVTDPEEPVIGFFNISPLQELRIFIDRRDLNEWGYRDECVQFNVLKIENNTDSINKKIGGLIPIFPTEITPGNVILAFDAAPSFCVDCRLRGTNVKPAFWK